MTAAPGFYWSYKCRDCFHCKRKRFNNIEDFSHWLRENECEPRNTWEDTLVKKGFVMMYWCSNEKEVRPKCNPPGVGSLVKKGKFCHHIDI